MRSAIRPGAAVPPPRPSPRIATPVALAAASAADQPRVPREAS